MDTDPLHLAVIIGSTREGRFATVIADWFAATASRRDGFEFDVIDLAELRLPPVMTRRRHPSVEAFAERIENADAFVVITPEYNHGYPAPLKHAIDLLYEEWRAKPVGFVSYGGLSGGQRAVEQLRQVFAEVRAVTVRETVAFADAWKQFDASGSLADPAPAEAAVKLMLDEIAWYAHALRTARRYGSDAARTTEGSAA